LTAVDDGILNNSYSDLLMKLLYQNNLRHTHFQILDEANHADIRKVVGEEGYELDSDKGTVIKELIPWAVEEIKSIKSEINWAVCTGLQESEKELAIALFQRADKGKRVLVPKPELVSNLDSFNMVLPFVDLVVMNEHEFSLYPPNSPSKLLKKGPRILIITKDKEGGEVYLKTGESFEYKPFLLNQEPESNVGAGDWFTGGFVSFCEEKGHDLFTNLEKIKQTVGFAAQVSAKKLLYQGGSNGPTRKDIITGE
jgi:sugar/nucleoside kinase (ribokinase family)